MAITQFYLGDWQVEPSSNTLRLGKFKRTIEPKAMDVLLLLCQQAGEVVSADDIVRQCWPDSPVGDNPIHKTITQLRKALDDKASDPLFIETIRKRGYRVIADVQFVEDEQTRAAETNWQGQSPFPGLTAFTQQESQVYYGRNAAVKNLIHRLAEQCNRKRPFTLIIGPSGSGKSSLVHAGLLPRMLNEKGANGIRAFDYISIDFSDIRPAYIIEELAACMLDWDINDAPMFEGESADSLAIKLTTHPEQIIHNVKTKLSQSDQYNTLAYPCFVIVLDRLEAYLATSAVSVSQRNAVFSLLDTLSQSGIFMILLVCRNDFYHQLAAYPTLMKNKERGAHFDLTPPSAGELSQMIRLPAIAAGLNWEEDDNTDVTLDDIILTDAAAEPDCLPLLQYTLQELYLQRKDNTLLVSTYKQLGGIEGAIGHKAEQLFQHMPAKVQTALDRVLPLIITLANDGNTLTSRTALWSELTNDNEKQFATLMVENRLFVSHLYQDKACFKVAHEAVLRRWQRVQTWQQQHQSSLVSKNRLEQQTQQWLQDNKSKAFLLTEGKPLTDALALKGDTSLSLSQDELALIKASQKTAQRKRIIRRVTLAALACLTVVSFGAMLQSQQSQHLAERKRLEAENLMGYMIGDFADKLRSVKRMDLLEGISEQALSYVEQAQQASEYGFFTISPPKASFELRFQHALSLQAMAEVRFYRDDTETAKQLYEEADKRLSALLEEQPNNFELLKAAGANAFWLGNIALGNIALGNRQFEVSRAEFKRYVDLSKQLVSAYPDNLEALLELSYAYSSLGGVEYKTFKWDAALTHFRRSINLKKQYLDIEPHNIHLHSYTADTLSWIASTLEHKGQLADAKKILIDAQNILTEQLEINPDNAEIKETLAFVFLNLSELNETMQRPDLARNNLLQAKELFENALNQDPDNSYWKHDLVHTNAMLVRNSLYMNDHDTNEQEITLLLSEVIKPYISIKVKLVLIKFFLVNKDFSASKLILSTVDEHFETEIEKYTDKYLLENAYELTEYFTARVYYKRYTGLAYEPDCQVLQSMTDKLLTLSLKPTFLIANHLSKTCLGILDEAKLVEKQLNLMNINTSDF